MPKPSRCDTHFPVGRLITDLALADQLEAVGGLMPCRGGDTVGRVDRDAPAGRLLRQAGTAVRDLIRQRDAAADLVRDLAAFAHAVDSGYLGSRLEEAVALFFADVDVSPAYAEPPCTCVSPRTPEAENGKDSGGTTP